MELSHAMITLGLEQIQRRRKPQMKPCKKNLIQNKAKVKGVSRQIRPADTFRYLLELWDDLMFLAEMMLSDSTASAAPSSTSVLFLMRPDRTRDTWS